MNKIVLLNEPSNYRWFVLLNEPSVIRWLFGDLSFIVLSHQKNKTIEKKQKEDEWGKKMLNLKNPDLKINKQWTNKFGEQVVEEMFQLQGIETKKYVKKNNFILDLVTPNEQIEVKTGTYYTSGTAHEKIIGTPIKYSSIPDSDNPLNIVLVGYTEKICRDKYGLLSGDKCTSKIQEYIDFINKWNIYYIPFTQMLSENSHLFDKPIREIIQSYSKNNL